MAAQLKPDPENLLSDPTWFFFDFNTGSLELTVLSMTENDYRRSVFLDVRIESTEELRYTLQFRPAAKLFEDLGRPPAATSYIFHIGHCGSTLLSWALSASDRVLPLREPQSFRRLARLERELGDPVCLVSREHWQRLFRLLLHSYGRTFQSGQRALVKATSINNNLIGPTLDEAPESRALLLYQPLDAYIAGMFAREQIASDIFNQAEDRMRTWLHIPGATELQNWRLNPLQKTVISWLGSMHHLEEAQGRYPDRAKLVNFEAFLDDPESGLVDIDGFLGLNQPRDRLLEHYTEVSQKYSKNPGKAFSADDRHQRMEASLRKNAGRIERGRKFANALIGQTPALQPLADYLE